jgi:hypothetical protein
MTEIKNIAAVEFNISGNASAFLFKAGKEPDYSACERKEHGGYVFYCKQENLKDFEYKETEGLNIFSLRLKETVSYCCKITGTDCQNIGISISNEENRLVKTEHETGRLRFQFINYLGKSRIIFALPGNTQKNLDFEIVPDKISYEEDYIALTEAIADKCSALLLDYSSPASLTFTQQAERQNTSLEQFIFLRSFCYSGNISGLFASIKRNPDRILAHEDEMRPFGMGIVSKKFFSSPFSYGRGWAKTKGSKMPMPCMAACVRKYDSYDTPANRFIKFALSQFSEICSKVKNCIEQSQCSSKYIEEASAIQRQIDEIMSDPFFDDVQELAAMPSDSQVLEKREGYSQIFKAFSMLDLALQLNWKGKDDVYMGEAKNTALLYEYWLFFELRSILKELNGQEDKGNGKDNFIKADQNGLTVSLKQGTMSMQQFHFAKEELKVNLYYNRTFSHETFSRSPYKGSYSRVFRPDYTIAIFPQIFAENEAIAAGEVSYIHFDAKYRIEEISKLIGGDYANYDEINSELVQEKQDETTNTYKRGDLLKMHTYNDAIRRTAGSYVLYPGTGKDSKMSEYDEILPGVGAFSIRPGNAAAAENPLKEFLSEVLKFKAGKTSRQYRKDYFENIILSSPKYDGPQKNNSTAGDVSAGESNVYMIGFMREEYIEYLADYLPFDKDGKPKQPKTGKKIYFCYYAIKDGYVYPQHKDISKAGKFLAWHYKCGKSANGTEFYNFTAEIKSTRLVSRKEMCGILYKDNAEEHEKDHKADYYFIVELKDIQYASADYFSEFDIEKISKMEGNRAISRFSPMIKKDLLFIRKLLILQFLRHAEFISASLRLKEVLKQVQDDEVIFAFFIITLYQYFSLKEPKD